MPLDHCIRCGNWTVETIAWSDKGERLDPEKHCWFCGAIHAYLERNGDGMIYVGAATDPRRCRDSTRSRPCARCGQTKRLLLDFAVRPQRRDGFDDTCRDCRGKPLPRRLRLAA